MQALGVRERVEDWEGKLPAFGLFVTLNNGGIGSIDLIIF
jgi:hypothetical protein